MRVIVPEYYKEFKCIASKCKNNCCIGWEIDIDKDTYELYKSFKGDFLKKITDNIIKEDDVYSFKLTADKRCPFLDKNNLCEIINNYGENHLCQICSDHPRFFNCFFDMEEAGIGITCEEACRIVLSSDKNELCVFSDDKYFLTDDEDEFFKKREKVFEILKDRKISLENRIEKVFSMFKTEFDISFDFWISKLNSFEIMDEKWSGILRKVSDKKTNRTFSYNSEVFERLLLYFLYRHLYKSLICEKFENIICFCVLCTYIVWNICFYLKGDKLSFEDISDIARLFSSEIEYSEENTNEILRIVEDKLR